MTADVIPFETDPPVQPAADEPALVVDVEGFEGPLDLLLVLARQQKVDLAKISILALADQFLAFIDAARRLRLELAADYLVMAAWLAYLKSRLLLSWRARSLAAMYSSAAIRSRSPRSSARNGRRRSTISCPPTPRSGSGRCWRTCMWPSARSGRWPKRAKRSSA
jgi:hypothetical protein